MRAITILLLLILTGCSTIRYTTDAGTFNYTRIGSQAIKGLKVGKTADSFVVELESNVGDGGRLADIVAETLKQGKGL